MSSDERAGEPSQPPVEDAAGELPVDDTPETPSTSENVEAPENAEPEYIDPDAAVRAAVGADDDAIAPVLPPVDEPPADPPLDEAPTDGDKPRRRRRWPLFVAAAVVLLGGVYVGAYFLIGDRLAAETTIAGVDVGGQSPAKAEATLTEELGPRENQNLVFELEDQQFTFAATVSGLTIANNG